MSRCFLALLVVACSAGQEDPTVPEVDDTDVAVDTDPVDPPRDSGGEDTAQPLVELPELITEPVPGMVVDRGAVAWQRILREPIRCYFIGSSLSGLTVRVVGLPGGTEHLLASGITFPVEREAIWIYNNTVAATERHLFLAASNVYRISLHTGTVESLPIQALELVSHDIGFTLRSHGARPTTYVSWSALQTNEGDQLSGVYASLMGDGPWIYSLGPDSEMVRHEPATGGVRRRLDIENILRDYVGDHNGDLERADVVDGQHLVFFERSSSTLFWYDLEAGTRRAVVPFSEPNTWGMECMGRGTVGP